MLAMINFCSKTKYTMSYNVTVLLVIARYSASLAKLSALKKVIAYVRITSVISPKVENNKTLIFLYLIVQNTFNKMILSKIA